MLQDTINPTVLADVDGRERPTGWRITIPARGSEDRRSVFAGSHTGVIWNHAISNRRSATVVSDAIAGALGAV
jgi:hypothetical protein